MSLLIHFHLHAHLLLVLHVHIPPALAYDIVGLLARLVDLLVRPILFLLEQHDPIGQQFEIFFRPFPGDFGRHELSMQRFFIVLFVRS